MQFATSDFTALFMAILVGLSSSLLFAWPALRIARRFGIIDYPLQAEHKRHSRPTPLAGGVIIVLALAISSFFFMQFVNQDISVVFLGVLIVFSFGLLDDRYTLRPRVKLFGQILAAVVLVVFEIRATFLDPAFIGFALSPQVLGILNTGITILWVVGITNAMNLVDSADGLAVSLSGVASAFFLLALIDSQQSQLAILAAIMGGICFSLLFLNSSPAYLFLGDSGSQTLGFLLASIGILYTPIDKPPSSSWFVPILFLGVPIIDTTLVILSRLRRRQGIFQASLDHSFHRLVSLGLPASKATQAMVLAAMLLNSIAIIALSMSPLQANSVFFICLLLGGAVIWFFERKALPG